MNREVFDAIDRAFQPASLERIARAIAEIERTFCYRRFADSAACCAEELRAAGLADVQLIAAPADGRTTNLDFTMPQAWDVEGASLEVIMPGGAPVPLIDYRANPLAVANRCAPTPPGGIVAEVIGAWQLRAQPRAAGQLVYTGGQPPASLRAEAAAKGALGLISDFSPARDLAPGETYWINGWGFPGWYDTREDRPLLCYSITPQKGEFLRSLLMRGPVRVQARADTRLYDGSIYTVTGLLPGQQEREVVLLAHIYEPFVCDDAMGAAAAIEIARLLAALTAEGALPALEYGVRVLISMERYGFAHYFAQAPARERAMLGIDLDCLGLSPAQTGEAIEVRASPAVTPFWGDALLWQLAQRRLSSRPLAPARGNLSDDTWISDPTVGIPSQWVWTRVGATHHSSLWFREEANDWPLASEVSRMIAGYVAALAAPSASDLDVFCSALLQGMEEDAEAQRRAWAGMRLSASAAQRQLGYFMEWQAGRIDSLARAYPSCAVAPLRQRLAALGDALAQACAACAAPEPTPSPIAARARTLVPRRRTVGVVFSQARIPLPERMGGDYERALSWADGTRDLWELAERVQWDGGGSTEDDWLEPFIRYCELLARYGYIELVERAAPNP